MSACNVTDSSFRPYGAHNFPAPADHADVRLIKDEDGVTLVELLVTTLLLTLVLGATLTVLDALSRAAPAEQEWSHTLANTQAAAYRMTRELRQATSVSLITPYVASADIAASGATKHVLYECDLNSSCTRKSSTTSPPARGTGGGLLIGAVQNVAQSVPVFTQSGKYFQVTLKVRSAGALNTPHTHVMTYSDGFLARNL